MPYCWMQQKKSVSPELITGVEAAILDADWPYLVEEIPKAIKQSIDGLNRITRIVRAMKAFSHPGGKEKEAIDINSAIEDTIIVARNEWKYVATVNTDFDANLPLIPTLPAELSQVFLNLIVNSCHAINDVLLKNNSTTEKGIITISTKQKDETVEIRISDTGAGIPENIRNKVFDPFFTTKEVGKGTGQGLAISHSVIVNKHGGTINLESIPNEGTTFIICLPLTQPDIPTSEEIK